MRILVTDSDTRAALAAVRALGRQGHEVVTAGVHHPSIASASRFSARFETYPNPATQAAEFVRRILEIVERLKIDVLLPITEVTTLLIAEHQSELPSFCHTSLPSYEAVSNASNKAYVVTLAGKLGIPTPRTLLVNSAAEGVLAAAELPLPIVVKPSRSRVRSGSGWVSTSVSYAADAHTLKQLLDGLPQEAYPVLLQERIQGHGAGVFACYGGGKPVALFSHRRLREKPPSGGVSVLCESAALDPVAVQHATALLSHIGWRGVAMVEFKQDERDGSLRLMEINGRFWGSLQLAIDSGVNFPAMAAEVAMGASLPGPGPYRIGVRSRWLAGDLDALIIRLFHSRKRLNLPSSDPGAWRTLWNFLYSEGTTTHLEMEDWRDLSPAKLEWKRRLFGL